MFAHRHGPVSNEVTHMRLPLTLAHLDHPRVRERMLTSWQEELALLTPLPPANWPYGSRLSSSGWVAYPSLFQHAVSEEGMGWLAQQLSPRNYWRPYAFRNGRSGRVRMRVNPVDEAAKLAYGEFNIAYVRGVLTVAADEGITLCTIVRAGSATVPRWECSCMEGAVVSSKEILDGHRAYAKGRSAEISIPSGVNCHHTVFIPEWAAQRGGGASAYRQQHA